MYRLKKSLKSYYRAIKPVFFKKVQFLLLLWVIAVHSNAQNGPTSPSLSNGHTNGVIQSKGSSLKIDDDQYPRPSFTNEYIINGKLHHLFFYALNDDEYVLKTDSNFVSDSVHFYTFSKRRFMKELEQLFTGYKIKDVKLIYKDVLSFYKTLTDHNNIGTNVVTLDLGQPNINSLSSESKWVRHRRKNLTARTNEPIAFKLRNGNPFHFIYIVNSSLVSLFTSEPTPFDTNLTSAKAKKSSKVATSQVFVKKVNMDSIGVKDAVNLKKVSILATQKNPDSSLKKLSTIGAKTIAKSNHDSIKKGADNDLKKINSYIDSTGNTVKTLFESIYTYRENLYSQEKFDRRIFHAKLDRYSAQYINLCTSFNSINTEIIRDSLSPFITGISKYSDIQDALDSVSSQLKYLYSVQLDNYILPIDVNGKNIDAVRLTLERRDVKNGNLVDKYDYQVWIANGFKIDVSGGIFLSNLVNHSYTTVDSTVGSVQKKLILEKNTGNWGIGFGSLINLSYRCGASWIKPGLSIGSIITAENNLQFLVGGSAVLGKEERFVVSYGLAMGNITALETPYNLGGVYNLGSSAEVPTVQTFAFRSFWGVTYNITGSKTSVPTLNNTNSTP